MPASRSSVHRWACGQESSFPEAVGDYRGERIECRFGVGSLGPELNHRAAFGRQHHHAHDALAVHFHIIADDRYLALEACRRLDDLRRGTRMNPELVHDLHGALRHQRITEKRTNSVRIPRERRQPCTRSPNRASRTPPPIASRMIAAERNRPPPITARAASGMQIPAASAATLPTY